MIGVNVLYSYYNIDQRVFVFTTNRQWIPWSKRDIIRLFKGIVVMIYCWYACMMCQMFCLINHKLINYPLVKSYDIVFICRLMVPWKHERESRHNTSDIIQMKVREKQHCCSILQDLLFRRTVACIILALVLIDYSHFYWLELFLYSVIISASYFSKLIER